MSIIVSPISPPGKKNCLQIIQDAMGRLGLNQPTAVISSTDPAVLQMLSLLNEEGVELAERCTWQALNNTSQFTTVAAEIQGTIEGLAPGMRYILNDTIWNRTLRRPIFGPLSPQEFQQQKAMFINGPWNQYRIYGNNLTIFPIPVAGNTCNFEYVTRYWSTDVTGTTGKEYFSADSDITLLDSNLMTLGLIWRWREAKGLLFDSAFQKYETKFKTISSRDASKPTLNMGGVRYDILPGVFVPAGNWNL